MGNKSDAEDLPARRFRDLLRQIREELGGGRGWISIAARRIGVHRSTLVKVLHGAPVSASLIERSRVALGLDGRFFTDPSIGASPSYLAHAVDHPSLSDSPGVPGAAGPAFTAFTHAVSQIAPLLHALLRREPHADDLLASVVRDLEMTPLFNAYHDVRTKMDAGKKPSREEAFALAHGLQEFALDLPLATSAASDPAVAMRLRNAAERYGEALAHSDVHRDHRGAELLQAIADAVGALRVTPEARDAGSAR